ncbi:SMT1 [Symbiodinium necroappetens]|uniref:SMT1 protein n=1 Tax=Symbiodinium necroappetens TaxID=1628268 RepID=A0A812Q5T6_9DINO|nr:SMT1 [Symbiodinium necroappetens]
MQAALAAKGYDLLGTDGGGGGGDDGEEEDSDEEDVFGRIRKLPPDAAREKGKKAFQDGDYDKAIRYWQGGLKSILGSLCAGPAALSDQSLSELDLTLNLNIAMAYMKKEDYHAAERSVDKALARREALPAHLITKALYRKAMAQRSMRRLDQCLETLGDLLEVEAGHAAAKQMQQEVEREWAKQCRDQKKNMRKLFDKLSGEDRAAEEIERQQRTALRDRSGVRWTVDDVDSEAFAAGSTPPSDGKDWGLALSRTVLWAMEQLALEGCACCPEGLSKASFWFLGASSTCELRWLKPAEILKRLPAIQCLALELIGFLGEIDPDNSRVPDPNIDKLPEGIMKISVDERQALCHPLSLLGELAVDLQLYRRWDGPASLRATQGSLEEALDKALGGQNKRGRTLDSSLSEELLLPPDADGKEAIAGVAVSVHPLRFGQFAFRASRPECLQAWTASKFRPGDGTKPEALGHSVRVASAGKEDFAQHIIGWQWSIMSNSKDAVNGYEGRFQDESLTERTTTDEYYDLATDFYLYGWGSSFHFATRFLGESLEDSIVRHEHFLAAKLGLKPGFKVADLGMGVGGPLRSIQKFSNADVTGITINDYQEVFLESAKALKKGGKLFSYEWVMTDRFNPSDPEHLAIKKGIQIGDGIEALELVGIRGPLQGLNRSGFRILEHGDLVDLAEEWYGDHNVPWYFEMAQFYSFASFRSFALSEFGQRALGTLLWLAAQVGLVPEDASKTEQMLRQASINLVKGGELKIFTPMYYIVAEKALPQACFIAHPQLHRYFSEFHPAISWLITKQVPTIIIGASDPDPSWKQDEQLLRKLGAELVVSKRESPYPMCLPGNSKVKKCSHIIGFRGGKAIERDKLMNAGCFSKSSHAGSGPSTACGSWTFVHLLSQSETVSSTAQRTWTCKQVRSLRILCCLGGRCSRTRRGVPPGQCSKCPDTQCSGVASVLEVLCIFEGTGQKVHAAEEALLEDIQKRLSMGKDQAESPCALLPCSTCIEIFEGKLFMQWLDDRANCERPVALCPQIAVSFEADEAPPAYVRKAGKWSLAQGVGPKDLEVKLPFQLPAGQFKTLI